MSNYSPSKLSQAVKYLPRLCRPEGVWNIGSLMCHVAVVIFTPSYSIKCKGYGWDNCDVHQII